MQRGTMSNFICTALTVVQNTVLIHMYYYLCNALHCLGTHVLYLSRFLGSRTVFLNCDMFSTDAVQLCSELESCSTCTVRLHFKPQFLVYRHSCTESVLHKSQNGHPNFGFFRFFVVKQVKIFVCSYSLDNSGITKNHID